MYIIIIHINGLKVNQLKILHALVGKFNKVDDNT